MSAKGSPASPKAPAQLDVTILGREYRVACGDDERPALLEAVAYLDARMREIRDAGKVSGLDRIAVMAALNITHALLRERKEPPGGGERPVDAAGTSGRIVRMRAAIDEALAAQDKLF